MSQAATFQVYSASAGSGKTFTLVKEYLKILLKSNDNYHFQKILALTFTNKAAYEMKERLLHTLQAHARGKTTDMTPVLVQETGLSIALIQKKSQKIIHAILQKYSGLHITTIDSFTHRIIRHFAYDFGLPLNFDVALEPQRILQEAVDAVLAKIGVEKPLSKALIQFAIAKSNEDKSWDINRDILNFAQLLLRENDAMEFQSIKHKDFTAYMKLYKHVVEQKKTAVAQIQELGEKGVNLILGSGLDFKDFLRSSFPNHFQKLKTHWEKASFFDKSKLRGYVVEGKVYSLSKPLEIREKIESILPQLTAWYFEAEALYGSISLCNAFLKSIIPLSVLSYVNRALENIKHDENIRLIYEFNALIFEKIQQEPTPYIYERLGEKFTRFFIDEMQDTSVLQWKNLIKLIDNPLSQENGSLLLVGDAKQAIYRWRGGASEQFIDLADPEGNNPFQIPKQVKNLDTNFRSYSEIIHFNNRFFQHIAGLMQNPSYRQLYIEGNKQKTNDKTGGYVQIDFISFKENNQEEKDLAYGKKVLEIIRSLQGTFALHDICILVRKNREGMAIATYLTEHHIPIVSSETLLLANDAYVRFLILLLQENYHPDNWEARFEILLFLFEKQQVTREKHLFIESLIHKKGADFYDSLQAYNYTFSQSVFVNKSLYDAVEYAIRCFRLTDQSSVYVQALLNEILLFQNKKGSDADGFLAYWELQKDKLSIQVPEKKNAVKIMSIHKAKGLQFPVVIYPYNLKLDLDINPSVWYPIENPEAYEGFEKFLIPLNNALQHTGKTGERLFRHRKEILELDNYNLLYVAMTRAVEQLYLIIEDSRNAKGEINTRTSSGLFMHYLQSMSYWNDAQMQYRFGDKKRLSGTRKEDTEVKSIQTQGLQSSGIETHRVHIYSKSALLWDTTKGEAVRYGNLIHEIMALIHTQDDLKPALQRYISNGSISEEEASSIEIQLQKVLTHPQLSEYFQHNVKVLNERALIDSDKQILIPDRVVFFPENEVSILDYKTGKEETSHKVQVRHYADLYREMGYRIRRCVLVYLSEDVTVVDC